MTIRSLGHVLSNGIKHTPTQMYTPKQFRYMRALALLASATLLAGRAYAKEADPIQKPAHIILIRHGETIRSGMGIEIQGWLNDPKSHLTAMGIKEASEVGKRLALFYKDDISIVYHSPLIRTDQTAREILAELNKARNAKHPFLSLRADRRFIEKCHGQHDGMYVKERNAFALKMDEIREATFRAEHPEKPFPRFFRWEYDPLSQKQISSERIQNPYEGELETVLDVYKRGLQALQDLGKKHSGEVVPVVTHGGFTDTMAVGISSEGSEEMLPRYYDPRVPGDKRLNFPKHGAAYHFMVYPDGKITFEGVENLLSQK